MLMLVNMVFVVVQKGLDRRQRAFLMILQESLPIHGRGFIIRRPNLEWGFVIGDLSIK